MCTHKVYMCECQYECMCVCLYAFHLWSGYDDSAINASSPKVLSDGQVLVRRARGRVHYQKVQIPPIHISQELLNHPCSGQNKNLSLLATKHNNWYLNHCKQF